ncbi:MAG: hydroxymethylglutaryl-CoA lyase [Spirochaetia bacterium]|nr:hydroxymethylglutaryl-CoA lyase [Spirochaetia bacterium]
MPAKGTVSIFEVGPRDGLQNESAVVTSADKAAFIELLADAGLTRIEASSFVRPGVIPQLSDAEQVFAALNRRPGVTYAALVPNVKGLEGAIKAGVKEVAVFTAASESFTKKNINCTIDESFQRFADVMPRAREAGIRVRGYVSTVVECPYEGRVEPEAVRSVCARLRDGGVYEISLGETIGTAVPDDIERLLDVLLKEFEPSFLAGHYHDTRGTAVANVMKSVEMGLRTFDSSAGGMGGCPYAPGAAGNAATEDVVYALERSGWSTGVDLDKLTLATQFISKALGRIPASKVFSAHLAKKEAAARRQA